MYVKNIDKGEKI